MRRRRRSPPGPSSGDAHGPISSGVSRRDVLRGAGLLGLGLSLGRFADVADARTIRSPGWRPFPHLPEGIDTLPQIEHIIIVMMENHSFDNYFGALDPHVGFPLATRRAAGVQRRRGRQPDPRLPDAVHLSAQRPPRPELEREPPVIDGGKRRLRARQRTGGDGVLDGRRHPFLLRPRARPSRSPAAGSAPRCARRIRTAAF